MKERSERKFVKLPGSDQEYEIDVRHSQGGMDYFHGRVTQRGFFLSVTPVKRGNGWVEFKGFSGTKILMEANKRYNAKRFREIVDEVYADPGNHPQVQLLFEDVLGKNGHSS